MGCEIGKVGGLTGHTVSTGGLQSSRNATTGSARLPRRCVAGAPHARSWNAKLRRELGVARRLDELGASFDRLEAPRA
jgi:hypothetical protein